MGAKARNGDAMRIKKPLQVVWVRIKTCECGKSEFRSQTGPVAIVCDIGVPEAHRGELRKLVIQRGEWGNKCKAANVHGATFASGLDYCLSSWIAGKF